ncbi:MAG TPA: hypothetical protein VF676_10975 [Flavobacterium sp.]|jgi:hypothetical protein
MKKSLALLALLFSALSFAQVDSQTRFISDSRQFYMWNAEKDDYELRETEYENSLIDIREIGSKSNGYVVISLTDNGVVRMYHGSITQFTSKENEGSWSLRSKLLQGKLTYNPEKNQFTYMYEAGDKRYNKIFVFNVSTDKVASVN